VSEAWQRKLSLATGHTVTPSLADEFAEMLASRPVPRLLYSDVRRCLDRLILDRRRLGIISNSRSEGLVRDALADLNILQAFEVVTSSGTERVAKPDSEIFRRTLVRMGVEANAALFVGDDLETDWKGAVAAGLHSVWLNRLGTGFGTQAPEITSLSEVPRIVLELEASGFVK
jgi:putative hydrolase of the HAD superfamily